MDINYRIPESIFEIVDTPVTKSEAIETVNKPVFAACFTSDKGTEKLTYVQGEEFFKMFGYPSFVKHGQPLLQTARTIKAGAKVLVKRIVADDAWLANTTLVAFVKKNTENGTCEIRYDFVSAKAPHTTVEGGKLPFEYTVLDVDGQKVSDGKGGDLKKVIKNYRDCTIDNLSKALITGDQFNSIKGNADEIPYPLFTITETGRGESAKSINISPNYKTNKNLKYSSYTLSVYEQNTLLETMNFSLDHDIIDNGVNKALENVVKSNSLQIQCKVYEDYIDSFYENVVETLNAVDTSNKLTVSDIRQSNILFGTNKDSDNNLSDKLKVYVNNTTGGTIKTLSQVRSLLDNGLNGVFGTKPINSIKETDEVDYTGEQGNEYTKQMKEFFDGTYSNDIWDLDNYKIDVIVDANYPDEVKKEIGILADWRKDIMYFRDGGTTGLTDTDSIIEKFRGESQSDPDDKYSLNYIRSMCIVDYPVYYDIIDEYSKKQVTVTIGYSLATLLVKHFVQGKTRPFAGQQFGNVIPEAIEGTVNFIPKNLRNVNQKEAFIYNKINYVNYYDGLLTLETLYTSQDKDTELSFLNNVIAIQEVIKGIRSRCPIIRYSYMDNTENLENYKKDVQDVLDNYSINFAKLEMVYLEDKTMIDNKVFYAAIQCSFKNFIQKEYFKIYPIEL